MQQLNKEKIIRRKLKLAQKIAIGKGLDEALIKNYNYICHIGHKKNRYLHTGLTRKAIITLGAAFLLSLSLFSIAVDYLFSARCLLPINHLVWEATRPLADCEYCVNVTKPTILKNITRLRFRLYEQTAGSYESLEDGCQFLNFKSDLFTLKEVFNMPGARVRNEPGQEPWYVGWGNCHPDILTKIRKYYTVPEFLPEDAEFPVTENIFFGYEIGAVMHLDYIPRLMWQGQVKGNKTWSVVPVPECEHVCNKFQYYVEPGDVVLLDTRVWYHATSIPKGQFSLTVQSEYG